MSEDRLGRIKQAIGENDGAPWPIVVEDCRWLISEVELLQAAIFEATGDVALAQEEVKRLLEFKEAINLPEDWDGTAQEWVLLQECDMARLQSQRDFLEEVGAEKKTTISTLRKAIEKAIHQLDWMLAPGHTRKEAVKILREAITIQKKETP